ncbi:MAG: hypothetical protein DMF93_17280 [Acidobacteria bacterium]|nr:MAG: hypothetical protein DMF93_17280 [Acidobacteriota bacterium]
MKITSRLFVAAVAAGLVAGAALRAQETHSSTLLTTEHYLDWERVSDAQISPDGARIVYTRQAVNKVDDKWESSLWILNADGSQHRFLVKGQNARWSPDGKRLLYLAEGEPKGTQLFVRWVDADGPPTQITHVAEAPRNAKWSPDGKSIAFSAFVPDQEKWTISMPAEPKGAKWTPAPRVVSTLHYRQDQIGFLEDGYTHLFVVPSEGGTPRQLDLRRRRGQRRGPRSRRKGGQLGTAGRVARRTHGGVHRPRGDRPLAHGERSVRHPAFGRRERHAQDQRRLRSRSDRHPLGARWQRPVFRRRR